MKLLALALLLAGCAARPPAPLDPATRFAQACEDARLAEPDEIVSDLQVMPATGPVRVVLLTDAATVEKYWSQPTVSTAADWTGHVNWVAPEAAVRDFCRRVPAEARATRLVEWLGLKPEKQLTHAVTLEVAAEKLARPCWDPEPTDATCELPPTAPTPDGDYHAWFVKNIASGYPWTRLGYTYDWAAAGDPYNPRRPVGVSELVLAPGAELTVVERQGLDAFCR